jgi:hypothetical protein
VVIYNRLWAVATGDLSTDRPLPVVATPMPDGEFTGRWRSIDVIVDPAAAAAATQTVQGVMVEHGQLMCVDLEALGEFRMWEPLDGLADFVCGVLTPPTWPPGSVLAVSPTASSAGPTCR